MVFVDGTGVGGGLVDHLRRRNVTVHDVQFAAKSDQRSERFANKRAEIWGILKEKLHYLSLPNDSELREQLIGPEFTLNSRDEILLEPKDSMKRRGVASPDIADALACTFACEHATLPVSEWDMGRGDHLVVSEYNPFDEEHLKGTGFNPRIVALSPRANLRKRLPSRLSDPHTGDLNLLTTRDHALGGREFGADETRSASRL
jgi:hypothetical protein